MGQLMECQKGLQHYRLGGHPLLTDYYWYWDRLTSSWHLRRTNYNGSWMMRSTVKVIAAFRVKQLKQKET